MSEITLTLLCNLILKIRNSEIENFGLEVSSLLSVTFYFQVNWIVRNKTKPKFKYFKWVMVISSGGSSILGLLTMLFLSFSFCREIGFGALQEAYAHEVGEEIQEMKKEC